MKVGQLAYTDVFGLPVIVWGGITTFLLLCLTAAISTLNHRGIRVIPFKYHKPMAILTILVGAVHGTIGILSNLGY